MCLQPTAHRFPEVACFTQASQRTLHPLPAWDLDCCSFFPLSLASSCLFVFQQSVSEGWRTVFLCVGSISRWDAQTTRAAVHSCWLRGDPGIFHAPFSMGLILSQLTEPFCHDETDANRLSPQNPVVPLPLQLYFRTLCLAGSEAWLTPG